MASTLQIIFAAGRLRLLVGGDVDLSDGAVLARATELLAEFSPSERQTVAAKAVELGADAAVVQALLGLVTGEVIEVSGRAPRRWPWWAWLAIGTTAAAAVGGVAGYRARRGRGRLAGSGSDQPSFHELIQDERPGSLEVAEDLLLQRGWTLREVTGGPRARNFTIALKPLALPGDQWKMVQINVDRAGGASNNTKIWVKYTIANGSVRVTREEEIKGDLDEAKKAAVATGWALAKAIKDLPRTTPEAKIRRLFNEVIDNGADNIRVPGLYGLGLTRPQKDVLARVVADYKDVVRTRGGYADPGEFRRRVHAAGLELETLRFDLTKRADLNRLRELYDLDAKAFKRLQQAAKDADAPTYEVMVTDDGMAIDWTANRIKPGAQAPYVFWIEEFESAQPAAQPALPPPPASAPVRQAPSELILRAARSVGPEGRFSDDKVFIAAAHKALLRSGVNMSLADFKRQLVKMLARGEVVRMRADLPGAMSDEQIALDVESEINSMGSLFNFIYLPERNSR